MHERYRRQTDGRAIAYSEREREFTFAKKTTITGGLAVVEWPRDDSRHSKNLVKGYSRQSVDIRVYAVLVPTRQIIAVARFMPLSVCLSVCLYVCHMPVETTEPYIIK